MEPSEAVGIVAGKGPQEGADSLANEARDRWFMEEGGVLVDDITVLVIHLAQSDRRDTQLQHKSSAGDQLERSRCSRMQVKNHSDDSAEGDEDRPGNPFETPAELDDEPSIQASILFPPPEGWNTGGFETAGPHRAAVQSPTAMCRPKIDAEPLAVDADEEPGRAESADWNAEASGPQQSGRADSEDENVTPLLAPPPGGWARW
eukprot:gnl/TRDRNA2_/TRDRNA2_146234_c0_seq1.p1 gnl/TRDRNA2_/TRDRNA2_146234_c0~~gnl/TRDRNA2_/TRDRNA2_146234_c0_seq1.p1  ORF type:complete len:238 (-),score=33.99 gnl/TRDRNA2_/TRDRNA2_146234_c0_seq1:7-618(-)